MPGAIAAPLPVVLPSSSKGTEGVPIPMEDGPEVECFKCGRWGHFHSKCTFKPLCVLCKEEGHTCDNRPSRRRPLQLQIMGSAILGEGFFCLQFDEDAEQDGAGDLRVENAYILLADPSKFTLHILQQELKHIVVGDWDWQVSQLGDNDFLVAFPASDLLHMAKTSGKLFLLINDITTTVREMLHENIEPTKMPEVWVKLHDEISLIRLGPLRLKLACQMPENLNDTIEVWFNHEGYHVKVELERLPKHGGAVGVQGPGPSDN
ncbi:heat stress transcription factor c-1b [Hordeum vulgare]|nr:heat stress transcription factor c-1b [Hordeum vulgare]